MKNEARELIMALRGEPNPECSFCGKQTPQEDLHPEEGGAWACVDCINKWIESDGAASGWGTKLIGKKGTK